MKYRSLTMLRRICVTVWILLLLEAVQPLMAEPTPAAVTAFNTYSKKVEARLAQQHRTPGAFLAPPADDSGQGQDRLRGGELIIERLSSQADTDGAMLHHWRGTAFA